MLLHVLTDELFVKMTLHNISGQPMVPYQSVKRFIDSRLLARAIEVQCPQTRRRGERALEVMV
jgi:hypothetical protein